MKIVRLYHKPPPVLDGDNEANARMHKVYLRKQQGSYLCAIAICKSDEVYNKLRDTDLLQLYRNNNSNYSCYY